MLGDYEGTVILISHDRDFLDRVVTSVIVPEGNGKWMEYAGGYTDMLAQRGADLKREAKTEAVAAKSNGSKSDASKPAGKRKLNFKDKHALETLPKAMDNLRSEIAKQQRHLDDPNLYKKDRKKFDTATAALSKAQKELQDSEEQWLELEMLREEIENA
jgi:ATP-binding cassette subfamily F protein uup